MFRRLRPSDRAAYFALAHEFYHSPAVLRPVPDSHLTRTFEELMRSDAYAEGYLLEQEGQPVGYALLARTYSQESGGFVLWVEELYVRSEARSAGLGRAFLRQLEETHPEVRAFRLEVEPDNARAARLYHALGYEPLAYQSYRKAIPPREAPEE